MISHRGISVITSPRERDRYLSCSLFILFLTEEKISQRCTETLSQPKAQNITAIVGCWVIDVRCWWLAIGVTSMITSLRGRGRYLSSSPFILFSQNYTEELISQRCTETLSQPKAQNVTAIVGCWVIDVRYWWLAIGVTSVITSPRGRGRYLSCSLFILFLTELHRRKDFTKVHRDIKSTDSTERYNYYWVLGDRC